MPSAFTKALLLRLQEVREAAGLPSDELARRLLIGPGWIERFERGDTVPAIDVLLAILRELDVSLEDVLPADPELGLSPGALERSVRAEPEGDDLVIQFPYANYDASYRLRNASLDEFERVLSVLREGLSRLANADTRHESAIKADSVAATFLEAVRQWPQANPSDLWWFLVYRAYCDPFNHPAEFARMSFEQSWKRTSGWALELVLVRHYAPVLATNGIRLAIETGQQKAGLVQQLTVDNRFEGDKVDVLLSSAGQGRQVCFGVVHVKASFAERRTDDVPASQALIRGGYASPLWTLDAKGSPAAQPINRGELGATWTQGDDRRSAKRKDIETDGYFSACFSYNRNTQPTPVGLDPNGRDPRSRIFVCDFRDPDDEFARWITEFWQRYATARDN